MAVVCSEIGEDFPLQGIQDHLFDSGDENEEEETYVETTFEVTPRNHNVPFSSITISHCTSSSVDLVGLQVWRGALLLSDFLLARQKLLQGKTVLELASGTGLTSIVAATVADSVTATDVNRGEILPLIRKNSNLNRGILAQAENFSVQELDFFWDSWPPDLEQKVTSSEVVLAADVVYDRHITEHFFKTLQKILQTPKVVFLAIERRQSDPRDSDQVFASNFAFFKYKLDALNGCNIGHLLVRVKQECIDFTQFFQYSRVPELTLWRVESADQISQELK